MLNKHNLAIAALAAKETSGYSMTGLLVEKTKTVATDGHVLVTVSTPEAPEDEIPGIEGITPTPEPAPFIMPAKAALELSRALPKRQKIAILENAVIEVGDGPRFKAGVTDIDTPRVFSFEKATGNFPNYSKVIPDPAAAEICICLDANKLLRVLQAIAPLAADKEGQSPVAIRFYDPQSPVRIDAKNKDTGQEAMAIVMPMMVEGIETFGVRRDKEEPDAEPVDATPRPERAQKAKRPKGAKKYEKDGACPGCGEHHALHLYRGFRVLDGRRKFFNGYICDNCAAGPEFAVKLVAEALEEVA